MARPLVTTHGAACATLLLGALLTAGVAEAQSDSEAQREPEPPVSIQAHAAAWMRLELVPAGDVALTIPLFRPSLSLSAFEGRLQLYVRPELAGEQPRLLDAYVQLAPSRELRVRAGRFKTPFSRVWMISTTSLELPDRGLAVDRFGADRAIGVMTSARAGDALRYHLGVFGSEGSSGDLRPLLVGRLDVTAYGAVGRPTPWLVREHPSGLGVGVNGYVRGGDAGSAPLVTGGIDAALVEGPLTLIAEGFLQAELDTGALAGGGLVQASLFLFPRWVELVARGSWVAEGGEPLEHEYDVGLTAHVPIDGAAPGERVKLSARYRLGAPEMSHEVIVQVQVSI